MSQNIAKKKFKYSPFHDELTCDCPDIIKLIIFNGIAFRWVHKKTTHFNCSNPNLIISPKRKYNTCKKSCGAYALSFFRSFKEAEDGLKFLKGTCPSIDKVVGDHVAECSLTIKDGMAENPRADGHFNFHEFEGTNLTNRFFNPVKVLL